MFDKPEIQKSEIQKPDINLEKTKFKFSFSIKELRFFYIIYLIVLGFIVNNFFSNKYETIQGEAPEIIGTGLAFGIVPFIIGLIRLIIRKKPTKNIYIGYFIISTLLFLLSVSNYYNRINSEYNGINLDTKTKQFYTYNYPGNEFKVTFLDKPKFYDNNFPFNGEYLKTETAELIKAENKSMYRAECFNYNEINVSNINENYVKDYLSNYADYTGFQYPIIQYEENDLGKIGSLRGFKVLENNNSEKIKVTYLTKIIFGNRSCIILYVGCPSEYYPTSSITNFLNSVKRV